ncbi:hypothetical protein EDB83DRAFT_2317387 [Lactarius deliciosus]|nr:hypothetical protein EDB83DRAFT_2317387 [Lactarius deliciosus]
MSPLRASSATTRKRRFQDLGLDLGSPARSPGSGTPCHCHPPPMFHNGSMLLSHPEYNNYDMPLKPELHVSVRESGQKLRRSFHLTQLRRSSLHLEKRLIKQKIEEHEISLQVLKEQMVDVENSIVSTTNAVGSLHCFMDQVGIPIPDMAEHVAPSIVFSEDDGDASNSQDGDDDDARGQSSASVDVHWANKRRHRPAWRMSTMSTGIVSGKINLQARISTHRQQPELEGH